MDIIEAGIILSISILNEVSATYDTKLPINHKIKKLTRIAIELDACDFLYRPTIKLPTISASYIIQNEKRTMIPSTILIKGDIIVLQIGDVLPCKCKFTYNDTILFFQAHHLLKITDFTSLGNAIDVKVNEFHFSVEFPPLEAMLTSFCSNTRPQTLVDIQYTYFIHRVKQITFILLIISEMVSVFRLAFGQNTRTNQFIIEMILLTPVYTLLPTWFLVQPMILMALRLFSSTKIIALSDALNASKVEFTEEEEDVDEFDVAPPPTRDIQVKLGNHLPYSTMI